MAGVPKEQLMAQLGPFLGSAISTVTQTYEKKMQVRYCTRHGCLLSHCLM